MGTCIPKDQHKLNENACYHRNLLVTNLKWHLIFQKSISEAYNQLQIFITKYGILKQHKSHQFKNEFKGNITILEMCIKQIV